MKKNIFLFVLLIVLILVLIASLYFSILGLLDNINKFEDLKESVINVWGSYKHNEYAQENYVKPIRNSAILVSLCSIETLTSFAVLIIYLLPYHTKFASEISEAKQRKREARKEKKIAKLKEKLNDMEQ